MIVRWEVVLDNCGWSPLDCQHVIQDCVHQLGGGGEMEGGEGGGRRMKKRTVRDGRGWDGT